MRTDKNIFPEHNTLTANQIVSFAIELLSDLNKKSGGFSDMYDYDTENMLKGWLDRAFRNKDIVKNLSKKSIINLIGIQRKLRYLPEHRFYMLFDFND